MAQCACIRCLGKGEVAGMLGTPVRYPCTLCRGEGILEDVDDDCAAAVANVFPAHYEGDDEALELDRGLHRSAKPTRRAASREGKSTEQRCATLEGRFDRLLARVETLEAGRRAGGRER